MDRVAWQATVHRVTKRWTRLSDFTSPQTAYLEIKQPKGPDYSQILQHLRDMSFFSSTSWEKDGSASRNPFAREGRHVPQLYEKERS